MCLRPPSPSRVIPALSRKLAPPPPVEVMVVAQEEQTGQFQVPSRRGDSVLAEPEWERTGAGAAPMGSENCAEPWL